MNDKLKPMDNNPLSGRTIFIPQMSIEAAAFFAAAFRSIGIHARVYPESDNETIRLGEELISGDECYPQKLTLGNFHKIIKDKAFDPEKTAFFMPAAGGPCRFGQYVPYMKKVLRDIGYPHIPIITLMSDTGYNVEYEGAGNFQRNAWRAIVCADILRKLLLKTRPYEINPGETDQVHKHCLDLMCKTIEIPDKSNREKLKDMTGCLETVRDCFHKIEIDNRKDKLFIGIVGEIFCRLEEFSNNFLIRIIEKHGGEVWLANMAEWLTYVNFMHSHRLKIQKKKISGEMLKMKLKNVIQHRDEIELYKPFKEEFKGYEEAAEINDILTKGIPYLPYRGALGEMTLSVGTSIYFYEKGIDGIIDISPFTCMNGIATEAVYPKIAKDHNNLPMRVFYFDGTETDLDRDVSIFLEQAKTYRKRKTKKRIYPLPLNFQYNAIRT